MVSSSYVCGALDTLVKAGALTPSYADGVKSVIEKQAAWGRIVPYALGLAGGLGGGYLLGRRGVNKQYLAYQNALDSYGKANPGYYDTNTQRLKISPDDAVALVDKTRPISDGWWRRNVSIPASNRFQKWTRWLRDDPRTPAMFDRMLKDDYNRDRDDYIRRTFNRPGYMLDPSIASAVQDAHVRDAKYRALDAERVNMPLPKDYHKQYQTPYGSAASTGGLRTPIWDTAETQRTPPDRAYRP